MEPNLRTLSITSVVLHRAVDLFTNSFHFFFVSSKGFEYPSLNSLKYALCRAEDLPDREICSLVRDFIGLPDCYPDCLPKLQRSMDLTGLGPNCNLIKTLIELKK